MATNRSSRLDAQDAYFLSNQLQSFDQTKYYHLIPGVVGRRIVPAASNVSAAMPVYKWRMTKLQGAAKKGLGHARNAPTVSLVQTEETQAIKTFETTQQYSIDEVRAAREAGEDLPEDTRRASVAAIEASIDTCIASGDTVSGITGLENNSGVLANAAGTAWASATADQILTNLTNLVADTMAALKQGQVPNSGVPAFNQFSLYIPESNMIRLATLKLGSTDSISVLKYIRDNFYMIKDIKPWHRLTKGVLAPALDDGSMNPMAAEAILPMDFEQLPEQYEGRNIVVPCAGKCGGVAFRYPIAFRYLTGL
jgi:hypothetical protein